MVHATAYEHGVEERKSSQSYSLQCSYDGHILGDGQTSSERQRDGFNGTERGQGLAPCFRRSAPKNRLCLRRLSRGSRHQHLHDHADRRLYNIPSVHSAVIRLPGKQQGTQHHSLLPPGLHRTSELVTAFITTIDNRFQLRDDTLRRYEVGPRCPYPQNRFLHDLSPTLHFRVQVPEV